MALQREKISSEQFDCTPLVEVIRAACMKRLASAIQNKRTVNCMEIANQDDFLYGQWMALILLSGPAVQVTLKAHYYSRDIKAVVKLGLRNEQQEVKEAIIMDFMREFCNLAAGEVKSTLLSSNIAVGLSLPLITRGFDEVLFSDAVTPNQIRDWWALSWGDGQIICTAEIEVFNHDEIANIKAPSPDQEGDDDGDIDFL